MTICQRNLVAAEFDWKATNKGEYHGNPPTNKVYEAPCVMVFELENAEIKLARYYFNTRLWDMTRI